MPQFRENPKFKGKTYEDFCHRCPVKSKCNEFATLHEEHGVWGNATEGEREIQVPVGDRVELREYKADSGTYWPLYGRRKN